MTRMIPEGPETLYGPTMGNLDALPRPELQTGVEANPRCVSCAQSGTSRPLATYFLVSGTSYCETHAVQVLSGPR